MPHDPYVVLFVSTHNSARSLMAEAIVNGDKSGRFRAHSAGTHPAAEPGPYVLETLRNLGHDTGALRPKGVEGFTGTEAPPLDFVFVLCDRAAGEDLAPWAGQPVTADWSMADPAAEGGSSVDKAFAYKEAYRMLYHRLGIFMALPFDALDRMSLQDRVETIGSS